MSSSPSTSPVYTIHREVKDAADAGDITNRALGMNMHGFKTGDIRVVPSANSNPTVEVLFWSGEAGKFVSRVHAVETGGFGDGVAFDLPFKAFGSVAFVKVKGGVSSGDTVTITMAGAQRQAAESDVLLRFIEADLTQNTAGRYVWDPFNKVLHGPFGAGELAAFWLSGRKFAQIHEAWDETCGKSETFSAWTLIGGATVDSDDVVSPDPNKMADKLNFGAAAGDGIKIMLGSATDNTDQTDKLFVCVDSGTKGFRLQFLLKDGTTATSGDLTATTEWLPVDFTANILAGATPAEIRIINDSGGNAGAINIFGNNTYKDMSVPGPYMTNDSGSDATYAKDQVSFAAGIVPAEILSGRWATKFMPFWAIGEHENGKLLSFDVSPSYEDIREITNELQLRDGGAQAVITAGLSWARNALVTVAANAPAGTVEISGAASGNGVHSGSPWVWTSGNKLALGSYAVAMIQQINGLICEPYRP